jgi:hypothetical protein
VIISCIWDTEASMASTIGCPTIAAIRHNYSSIQGRLELTSAKLEH